MDIFQSEVTLLILSFVLTGVTQLSKKTNLDTKVVVVGLGIVLGALYFLFQEFVDAGTQDAFVTASVKIIGYATVVYNLYKVYGKITTPKE